jgi:senataxin
VLEAQLSKLQNSDGKGKKGVDCDDTELSIKAKVNLLYKQRRQVCGELVVLEASEKRSIEEARNKRQSLKKDIIQQAEIVVATLSGCGGDVFSACLDKGSGGRRQPRNLEEGLFDAVVIDEAAQVSLHLNGVSIRNINASTVDCLMSYFLKALEPATLIPLQLLKQMQAKCIMVRILNQLPRVEEIVINIKFLMAQLIVGW